MPYLIVFDLDGTLVDSRRDLAESANEMLATYGARPLSVDAVTAMVGEGARVLVQRALVASGLDPDRPGCLEDFLAIYDRHLTEHTREYPGVRDALASVAGRATLALLTNKPGRHTRRLLDVLDLTRFFDGGIIGGDDPWPRKPDPAGLAHFIDHAGVQARDTLMVGDSPVDADTARRAGVRMCFAKYGFGFTLDQPPAADALIAETSTGLGACLDQFLNGPS